ncbi:MAG: hypothetical protein JNL63_06035 [Bacteroidia bacterium]|nr:hypothetical protein [Bacteroidia bacterium]
MGLKKSHKRITIEELRKFEGLENITDEEAEENIIALEKLSVIMFELWKQDQAVKSKKKAQ